MKLLQKIYIQDEHDFLESIVTDSPAESFIEWLECSQYSFEEKARIFVEYENSGVMKNSFFKKFWEKHKKTYDSFSISEISGYYTKDFLEAIEKVERLESTK